MTDYKKLCAELVEKMEYTWGSGIPANVRELLERARTALAEPEPEGPTAMQLIELSDEIEAAGLGQIDFARAVLARWGNLPESPDSSDGPTVFNHRESASVMDQLKYQLFLKVKADLIREVINQALKDTASVHWRVTNTGEQIVRVGDLLRWAEQAANRMESAND